MTRPPHAASRTTSLPRLFQRPEVLEVSTASFDPDKQGVGTSPITGDVGSSWLFIPQAANTPATRYLFRLCGLVVPTWGRAEILGIRQFLSIAQEQVVELPPPISDAWISVIERPIVTPNWTFADGNVSWHLRIQRGASTKDSIFPAGVIPQPSWSLNQYGTDSALVAGLLHGLEAPTGNVPPGDPVGSLGTFRDLRFPWTGSAHDDSFGHEVIGPAIISLWASVLQTNPESRPFFPKAGLPTDLSGWVDEDRFLLSFGDPSDNNLVRYRHIGGSITANVGPIDVPWSRVDSACEAQKPVSGECPPETP